MLRFFVFGNVFQQCSLIRKAFIAGIAFVWFVSGMASRVRLEVRKLRESLRTAWMPTFIRFVACVRADMLLEMRELRELPLANFTTIWLDAQVNSGVL
jgi:hypothetical protein